MGVGVKELIGNEDLCDKVDLNRYVDERTGFLTLQDILKELKKPERDPRPKAVEFHFAQGVTTIDDLKEGMIIPGVVTNITNFGAFIDIGVHQDGLVHISEIADKYILNPTEVLYMHQPVTVKVIQVDKARRRIGLSIRQTADSKQ